MAFPSSYVNGRTLRDYLSQPGFTTLMLGGTINVQLYGVSVAPGTNKNSSENYASWPNHRIGAPSSLPLMSVQNPSNGAWGFTANPVEFNELTANGIAGGLVYQTADSQRVICAINFGSPSGFDVFGGTFRVIWSASGIFRISY